MVSDCQDAMSPGYAAIRKSGGSSSLSSLNGQYDRYEEEHRNGPNLISAQFRRFVPELQIPAYRGFLVLSHTHTESELLADGHLEGI